MTVSSAGKLTHWSLSPFTALKRGYVFPIAIMVTCIVAIISTTLKYTHNKLLFRLSECPSYTWYLQPSAAVYCSHFKEVSLNIDTLNILLLNNVKILVGQKGASLQPGSCLPFDSCSRGSSISPELYLPTNGFALWTTKNWLNKIKR